MFDARVLGVLPPRQAQRTRSRQVRGSVLALSAGMFSTGLVSAGSVGNVGKQGKLLLNRWV